MNIRKEEEVKSRTSNTRGRIKNRRRKREINFLNIREK